MPLVLPGGRWNRAQFLHTTKSQLLALLSPAFRHGLRRVRTPMLAMGAFCSGMAAVWLIQLAVAPPEPQPIQHNQNGASPELAPVAPSDLDQAPPSRFEPIPSAPRSPERFSPPPAPQAPDRIAPAAPPLQSTSPPPSTVSAPPTAPTPPAASPVPDSPPAMNPQAPPALPQAPPALPQAPPAEAPPAANLAAPPASERPAIPVSPEPAPAKKAHTGQAAPEHPAAKKRRSARTVKPVRPAHHKFFLPPALKPTVKAPQKTPQETPAG